MTQTVKNPLAVQETWIQSLGPEDPLEDGTPVQLPRESPGTEEPGRLQFIGSHRAGHD